jgi:hypothetical protein
MEGTPGRHGEFSAVHIPRFVAGLIAGLVLLGGCAAEIDGQLQSGSVSSKTTGPAAVPSMYQGQPAQTADWKVAVRSILDPYVLDWASDDDGFNIPILPRPPAGERLIQIDLSATNTRNAPQQFPENNVALESETGEIWGSEGIDAPWGGADRFPAVAPGETTVHRYFFVVRDDDRGLAVTFEPIRLTGPKVRFPLG